MIGFIVEDNAHEKTFRELSNKLHFPTQRKFIRLMQGDRLQKGRKYALDLISRGCHRVIVVKDSDGASHKVKQEFNNVAFSPEVALLVIVREIKAWFLADEQALQEYLGRRVRRISEPETVADHKDYLNRIFENVRGKGNGYQEGGQDPAEIAKRLRVKVLEKKCPSFRNFLKLLRD